MSTSITETQSFSVEIEGKVKAFPTRALAAAALAKVELKATAQAYVDQLTDKEGKAIGDKDKKGKFNVVLDFLAYNAASAETSAVDPEKF